MSLRTKTLFLISLALISLVTVSILSSWVVLRQSIAKEEERMTREEIDRFKAVWGHEIDQLGSTVDDWAKWDDTYVFISGEYPQYVEENLMGTTYQNLELNLIAFVDDVGKIIYGGTYNPQDDIVGPLPEDLDEYLTTDGLLASGAGLRHDGVIDLRQGPLIVVAHPILTTAGEGPVRGTLIFGRYLDQIQIGRLSRLVNLPIVFQSLKDRPLGLEYQQVFDALSQGTDAVIRPLSTNTIAGYAFMRDVSDRPALILRVDVSREFYQQMQISQQTLLVSLIVVGLVFIVLVIGLMEKLVLQRLARMGKQLNQIGTAGNLSERVDIEGKDELARLGGAINRMLDDLQGSQKALAESEQKYRQLVEQSTLITYTDLINDSSSAMYMSPQVYTMLGFTVEEWLEDPDRWLKVIHPEDYERVFAEHLRTNSTFEPFCAEYRMVAADGHVVWVRDEAVVIFDEGGKPLYWQGVLQDITERKRAEEAERRQRDLAEALRQTGVVLNTSLDLDSVLDRLLEEIGRVVPYDSGSVLLVNDGVARIVRMRGYEKFGIKPEIVTQSVQFEIKSYATFRQMYMTGSPFVVGDTRAFPDWITIDIRRHVRSWAGAPMISQGQLFGFISLEKTESGFYQMEHADRLAIFASQAALALQNARLFEVVQCHAEENRRLREAASVITSALELDQVLEHILNQLEHVLSYDSAAIFITDDNNLRRVASRGFLEPSGSIRTNISLDDGLVQEARRLNRPVVIKNVMNDTHYRGWCGDRYAQGWLGAPLFVRGNLIGFLSVESHKPDAYGEAEINLVWAFTHSAAIAIDNARLFRQVHQLAITDSLTGIFNRRHLLELASHEFERARRFSRPLTLAIWDIDHFKMVNDTFGHLVGDQVLRMVAERCHKNLREADLLGRYGGEEFVAILTEANSTLGREICERLRAAVESPPYTVEDHAVKVSISVGLADIIDCPNLEVLLGRADQALLRAKQKGRNRVEAWEEIALSLESESP